MPGRAGLVSVTFRQFTPEEIIKVARQSGLTVIEWGGDVHVPTGDDQHAQAVAAMTREAGLETACYGSYYRVGHDGEDGRPSFDDVLSTAAALDAPCIRVWAGVCGSDEADEAYFEQVCTDANRIADLAQARGVRVAFESHGGTIDDTAPAAQRFLQALPHPNIFSLWPPLHSLDHEQRRESLKVILPRLAHVHAFHWLPGEPIDRPPSSPRCCWSASAPLRQTSSSETCSPPKLDQPPQSAAILPPGPLLLDRHPLHFWSALYKPRRPTGLTKDKASRWKGDGHREAQTHFENLEEIDDFAPDTGRIGIGVGPVKLQSKRGNRYGPASEGEQAGQ